MQYVLLFQRLKSKKLNNLLVKRSLLGFAGPCETLKDPVGHRGTCRTKCEHARPCRPLQGHLRSYRTLRVLNDPVGLCKTLYDTVRPCQAP